jgi:hypothetical protein
MKKPWYPLLLGFGLLAGACDEAPLQQEARVRARRQGVPQYSVILIEGCEYLRQETSNGYPVFTHKGNCRNPIHPYRDTPQRRAAR